MAIPERLFFWRMIASGEGQYKRNYLSSLWSIVSEVLGPGGPSMFASH